MLLARQLTPIATKYSEVPTTTTSIKASTSYSVLRSIVLRSPKAYDDEDFTTTSPVPIPASTTTSNVGEVGACPTPSCVVAKLSDAVIALGVLCGLSVLGFIILFVLFMRQTNSSSERTSTRHQDSSPSHSRSSTPLRRHFHDHLRDFNDTPLRRRRVYSGLGLGGSRDGRLNRHHYMHENQLARNSLARSPLAPPPRYMERAPENMPPLRNSAMFHASPGRRGLFARSPLAAMAGYPFMRNPNMNPMAFPQAQDGLGGDLPMQAPQMPHPAHMHLGQPPMYQPHLHQHPEQPGMMHPGHHHHAPAGMADMRAAQEQAQDVQQRGSIREEGNIGRSRDPSNAGTAVRDDAFGRLRREALGSRRPSRSETEGSRGPRGGTFNGGPPGPII